MDNWKKVSRTVQGDGSTTIRYEGGCLYVVESRKRPIPHANRRGTWMFTSYFVINPETGYEKEYNSLADAKAAAEKIEEFING